MLYINFKNRPQKVWHVGRHSPIQLPEQVDYVTSVQADGGELEYVRQRFPNIHNTGAFVIRWYGDEAKFIVGNLI